MCDSTRKNSNKDACIAYTLAPTTWCEITTDDDDYDDFGEDGGGKHNSLGPDNARDGSEHACEGKVDPSECATFNIDQCGTLRFGILNVSQECPVLCNTCGALGRGSGGDAADAPHAGTDSSSSGHTKNIRIGNAIVIVAIIVVLLAVVVFIAIKCRGKQGSLNYPPSVDAHANPAYAPTYEAGVVVGTRATEQESSYMDTSPGLEAGNIGGGEYDNAIRTALAVNTSYQEVLGEGLYDALAAPSSEAQYDAAPNGEDQYDSLGLAGPMTAVVYEDFNGGNAAGQSSC